MLNTPRRRLASRTRIAESSKSRRAARRGRRLQMESLESRHLLTGGLTLGADQSITLNAGAPLQIPINAVDTGGFPVTYSVSSTNPAITTLLPTDNPSLKLHIQYTGTGGSDPSFEGDVIIELFKDRTPNTVAQIVSLTNQHFYDGVVFHRVSSGFVNQAGRPTAQDAGITVPQIDDEFSPDLRFTSPGDLGMARSSHDTDTSEFFVTVAQADASLDYQYTMFGHVVSDPSNLMAKINAVPHGNDVGPNDGAPTRPVTITSATIIQDNYNLALQIAAPVTAASGTTGDVVVTATDGHGGTATQTFHVAVHPDTIDPPPFILPITAPPSTTVGTPVTVQIPAFDSHGDNVTFQAAGITTGLTTTVNSNINASTGSITVTPPSGFAGVASFIVGANASAATASSAQDTQRVPLFVDPAAPIGLTLVSTSDTGTVGDGTTSLNNADAGHTLQFMVSGVTAGNRIDLFNGLIKIGSAIATSSTVIVTTDGIRKLTDGTHSITAKQTLTSQTYHVGNASGTVDLASPASGVLLLSVDSTAPTFTSVPVTAAQVGTAYAYTLHAIDAGSAGITYSLVSGPAGMSVNTTSGVVTWTPTAAQLGSQSVQFRATDGAGNTTDQSFSVNVVSGTPIVGVSTTAAANSGFGASRTVSITVTFASPVNVTGTPQLSLNNGGTAFYAAGSGTATLTFVYSVAAGQDTSPLDYASTNALSLNGGTIEDATAVPAVLTLPATGTDGLAAQHISIDTVNPAVAVTPTTTNSHTPTISGTVTDSAPSSGIATVAVSVAGQTVNAQVNGTTWTASIPGSIADGTYDVQVTAIDNAGNQASTTATGALVINSVSPTVSDVSTTAAANSTFTLGQPLTINISFTEAVVVTGTPQLTLNNGAVVNFSSGSGSSTLSFVYTVGAGQSISPLDYSSVSSLALNGGTIKDTAGNAAVLTLPVIGLDNLAAKNITINSPAIVSDVKVTISPLSATALPGASVGYSITVTNLGPNAATGITVTDTLPASVTFGSQTFSSGTAITFSNNGNSITDTIASLASGASSTFTVVASVGVDAIGGSSITDTVNVSSTSLDTSLGNNTGTATTTVTASGVALSTDPFDSTKMQLVAVGTAGNDNISFIAATGGRVSVNMNGHLFGPFAATSRLVALGLAGNDVITVAPAIKLPSFLYAGSGIDRLTGGGGNAVLVGGGGADTLTGGSARNVIIAGAGASKLYSAKLGTPASSAGGSILIAGTTDFDKNDSALHAIMHEWGSADAYATRAAKIRTGGLGAGVAISSATVHPTARVVDQLFSTGGWDWFVNPSMTAQMLGIDPHKKSLLAFN